MDALLRNVRGGLARAVPTEPSAKVLYSFAKTGHPETVPPKRLRNPARMAGRLTLR
jgi:hypothetical protein